tara:strand:- start:1632 stop:1955 length:324 start_codon:yes stop_codon:yes gene_type:complete
MAIEYDFSRINPLVTSDDDGSNEKTTMIEFTLRGTETVNGVTYEAYTNHEIALSGDASVAPTGLNLDTLLNTYIADNNVKDEIVASISGQKEVPHEWTGSLAAPTVS